METVNERSTAYLQMTFKDKVGAAQTPTSISYRIDDKDTGAEIKPETSVSPASMVEIVLAPEDNRILNNVGRNEWRRVTVKAPYGASDQVTGEFVYRVINLGGVT